MCKLALVYMPLIKQVIHSVFIPAVPGAFEQTSLHPFLGAASPCLSLSLSQGLFLLLPSVNSLEACTSCWKITRPGNGILAPNWDLSQKN